MTFLRRIKHKSWILGLTGLVLSLVLSQRGRPDEVCGLNVDIRSSSFDPPPDRVMRSDSFTHFCCVHWTNWQVMKVGAALAMLDDSVRIVRSSFPTTVTKTDLFLLLLWTLLECCSFFLPLCVPLPGSARDIHRSILSRAHLSLCLSSFIAPLPHSVIQFPFWAYYAKISPCLVGSPSFIALIFHFYLAHSLERRQ